MPIPDFQSCMRPLLEHVADGQPHQLKETHDALAQQFGLSRGEIDEVLPSGRQTVFRNRVAWSATYLKKARLLSSPARGQFQITERGASALQDEVARINVRYLKQFPEFLEFHTAKPVLRPALPDTEAHASEETSTPRERLESAHQEITSALAAELLQTIKTNTPEFFEKLVVDLMVAMGYGGSRAASARATRLTGDDGIDGIINEDKLGLDTIYLQAKRWENTVHRPEIDKFIGALTRQGARKGVFITTSDFSLGAREAAKGLHMSIVLLDGRQLAHLMIEHDLGVATEEVYKVKSLNTDYFNDE